MSFDADVIGVPCISDVFVEEECVSRKDAKDAKNRVEMEKSENTRHLSATLAACASDNERARE